MMLQYICMQITVALPSFLAWLRTANVAKHVGLSYNKAYVVMHMGVSQFRRWELCIYSHAGIASLCHN